MDPRFDGQDGGEILDMREIDGLGGSTDVLIEGVRKLYPTWQGWNEKAFGEIIRHFTMVDYDPTRLDGLALEYVSGTAVKVNPGFCTDSSATSLIELSSVITINGLVSGAAGLQSGLTLAADTFYAVLVIGDKYGVSGTSAMLTDLANYLSPTLPTGYNIFRRVGWVRTRPGAATFYNFLQRGIGRSRWMYYEEIAANLIALNGGSQTTFTAINLASWVPPTSREIDYKSSFVPNSAVARYVHWRPGGSAVATPPRRIDSASNVRRDNFGRMPTGPSQTVEYEVSSNTTNFSFWVLGYKDVA